MGRQVACKRRPNRIVGMPDRDFPKVPDHREASYATVESAVLREMIERTCNEPCLWACNATTGLDDQRMGHVGRSPRGTRPVVYSWAIDAAQGRPEIEGACGEAWTLRAAKRRVEAAFRQLYSWRFPASRGY